MNESESETLCSSLQYEESLDGNMQMVFDWPTKCSGDHREKKRRPVGFFLLDGPALLFRDHSVDTCSVTAQSLH